MYYPPHSEGTPLSMKGATQFQSQPAPAVPVSPARPSTARSTIRAIPPSPPISIDDALRLELADDPARPYSDLLPGSPRARFNEDQAEKERVKSLAKYMANSEDDYGYKGSSFGSPGTVLRRGEAVSRHSPAAKTRSRSHSPQEKPFRSPAMTSHQAPVAQEQPAADSLWYSTTEDDIDEEDDSCERNFPETPTPMSREQRSQAYTPLGTPPPLFAMKREQSQHSNDAVHKTPSPKGQPTHALHHKHTLPHPSPSERNFKPHLRDMVSAARNREHCPAAIDEQTTPPVKTPPVQHPKRHASSSARSTISGGTAESRRSVFSTPGRDELERKKALVEIDEGPFARAVSVQDLDARRRQVSGKSDESEERGERGGGKRMWRKGCGMGEKCCVM
ncbi:hypothetical protein T440DRAFT_115861 [Plenodomus tracheiphilus IPT5]|uniref:Uncharacterized protein n=1 Tax=Plenodomus tracheiphilus IPT5 TaxID=1408161 RepID=A0A6A7B636_9PLEO|nr:hypothetical protein T440DRAFT_115861 [Plenodomus tracheiphilus IPT5]